MAENLRYQPSDGDWWCPDGDGCEALGVLYRWTTAVGLGPDALEAKAELTEPVQGVCMPGWHVPTGAEFETLLSSVGAPTGKKLKAISARWWGQDTYPSTDEYGFAALPAGYMNCWGAETCKDTTSQVGYVARFWAATDTDADSGWFLHISATSDDAKPHDDNAANSSISDKFKGMSIRCVEDSS